MIFQCTFDVQTEEEYWQLTDIEKEKAVVLTISQKKIRQLIKGLERIQQHNKKEDGYTYVKEVGLVHREWKDNNGSGGAQPQPCWQDGQQEPEQPVPKQQSVVIPPVSQQHILSAPLALNGSYNKPEFSGRPGEDPEAYILRMIEWMDTHNFAADQKVQRFPLILASEGNWK